MQNQHFSLIFIWEGLVIAVFTILEIVFNVRVFSLVSKAHEQNMMVRMVKGGGGGGGGSRSRFTENKTVLSQFTTKKFIMEITVHGD